MGWIALSAALCGIALTLSGCRMNANVVATKINDNGGILIVGPSPSPSPTTPSSSTTTSTTTTTTVRITTTTVSSTTTTSVPFTPPSGWPDNEPAGLTQILNANGSTKYYFAPNANTVVGAKWSDPTIYAAANNSTRVQVIADPLSKYGDVVQKWWFTGEQSGFNGEYDWQGGSGFGDPNGYKELYFRIVFKFDPSWQWEVAHTQKLFYFATNRTNQSGGGNANSFYLSVDRSQIDFVVQANPSASASANGDGVQYDIDYRYNTAMITTGRYITVEFWIRANSSPTTADGQARMWVDGNEITANMTALMGAYSGQKGLSNRIWVGDTKFFGVGSAFNGNFNNTQTLLYWGGQGDTAATNFYLNLSEFFISGIPG